MADFLIALLALRFIPFVPGLPVLSFASFPFFSPSPGPSQADGVSGHDSQPLLSTRASGTFTRLVPRQEGERAPRTKITVLGQAQLPSSTRKRCRVAGALGHLPHIFFSPTPSTHQHHHRPLEFSGLILVVKSHTVSQPICKPGRMDS